jgi:hypothetical protein
VLGEWSRDSIRRKTRRRHRILDLECSEARKHGHRDSSAVDATEYTNYENQLESARLLQ